jgi:NAD(P)-dependent dehydrogenase (short-subunit alcohol dehydrogenase family)
MPRRANKILIEIETVYQTNVFGPIRVTQAFLPLLRASGQAKVVMVSSGLGSLTWLSEPAHPHHAVNILGYNSSRTALNALSLSLAKDLAKDVINAPPIPATRRRTSTITPDIAPSNRLLTPSFGLQDRMPPGQRAASFSKEASTLVIAQVPFSRWL